MKKEISKASLIIAVFSIQLLICCNEETPDPDEKENACPNVSEINHGQRNFFMGFSTWPYGPAESHRDSTYLFIEKHADIYSEQIDHKIPWNAWINNTALPQAFEDEIAQKLADRLDKRLLLSVSLLNTDRSNLLEDYDGSIPEYQNLDDPIIADAYLKHLEYLIGEFNPDYLVMSMEVNDLLRHSSELWNEYRQLAIILKTELRIKFPNLPLAESITLHNWHNQDLINSGIANQIGDHISDNDFAAVSFYPFFKGQHTKEQFQTSLDFLLEQVDLPIAFVETCHLGEDLRIESFDLSIDSHICEQNAYLEVLFESALTHNYEFIIWWSHRDFDLLWKTLPVETQDIGKLWRDTGLLNENGQERPAFTTWKEVFQLAN